MADITLALGPEAKTAELTISGLAEPISLSVADVDTLIQHLAGLRASMQPAFPDQDPAPGTRAVSGAGMRWFARQDPQVETQGQLWMMHPGYGWLSIPLAKTGLAQLAGQLQHIHDRLPKLQ